MSFLTLENVTHHYFTKKSVTTALEDISFTLNEGEFISLVGPSGCGKSTILSIVAGIMEQTKGDVLLKGKPVGQFADAIGYMLQQDYLFPWKTIFNNMLLGPKIRHQITPDIEKKATAFLNEVGLYNVEDDYPDALSGGMRQRAALVRTLVADPKILLLDEPFSALDYQTKLNLEDLVHKLLREYHKTAILVTHDIGEAISMSDRILVMKANPGRITKTFEVPIELRNEVPFLVRRHVKYQPLFDKVWAALNGQSDNSEIG